VRKRSQLHLDVGGSLGVRGGARFGLGFGWPAHARGVLTTGVTAGLLGAEPPRRVFNADDRVGYSHVGVGRFRAQPLRRGRTFGTCTCLGMAFGWPWLAGVGGGLALTLDGALQGVGVGLELAPPIRARG
jgi:hypothetical protein